MKKLTTILENYKLILVIISMILGAVFAYDTRLSKTYASNERVDRLEQSIDKLSTNINSFVIKINIRLLEEEIDELERKYGASGTGEDRHLTSGDATVKKNYKKNRRLLKHYRRKILKIETDLLGDLE